MATTAQRPGSMIDSPNHQTTSLMILEDYEVTIEDASTNSHQHVVNIYRPGSVDEIYYGAYDDRFGSYSEVVEAISGCTDIAQIENIIRCNYFDEQIVLSNGKISTDNYLDPEDRILPSIEFEFTSSNTNGNSVAGFKFNLTPQQYWLVFEQIDEEVTNAAELLEILKGLNISIAEG